MFWWHFEVFSFQSIVKFSSIIFLLGLCPSDSYDEGVADMICDGVNDLFNVLIKTFYEKDATKKVIYLIGLLESVELMFLCILMELGCLLLEIIYLG